MCLQLHTTLRHTWLSCLFGTPSTRGSGRSLPRTPAGRAHHNLVTIERPLQKTRQSQPQLQPQLRRTRVTLSAPVMPTATGTRCAAITPVPARQGILMLRQRGACSACCAVLCCVCMRPHIHTRPRGGRASDHTHARLLLSDDTHAHAPHSPTPCAAGSTGTRRSPRPRA